MNVTTAGYLIVAVILSQALAYEAWAFYTQERRKRTGAPAWPTISQTITRHTAPPAADAWVRIVLSAVSVFLIMHFWWGWLD